MRPLLIGLAAIATGFVIVYAISGNAAVALLGAVAVLIVLPPSYDPAIIIKERQIRAGTHPETPSCFASGPGPQTRAENGCDDCPCNVACLTPRFISWYRPPLRDHVEYLAEAGDGEGFIYVRDKQRAHRFEEYSAALQATPSYDGSANIGDRAGVERVA